MIFEIIKNDSLSQKEYVYADGMAECMSHYSINGLGQGIHSIEINQVLEEEAKSLLFSDDKGEKYSLFDMARSCDQFTFLIETTASW